MTGEQPSAERVYTLEGFAVPEQIGAVHDLLAQAAHDHPELDPTDVMLFETAVIEIANNVVEYGQPEGEVRWRFTIQVRPEEIEADLDDTGQSFQPTRGKGMPDEQAEGGRGLPLAEALLDQIEFTRTGDTNHWRMIRRLGHLPQL
ncbi:ATP-binding protein [Cellulomonas denverensis]|uniref:ATP-binding protein n=1 Tax=Cellulomonas denverensis TaxID=264297 RepID=A0A7X6KV22_9CELL|nr:ATP-binding protein [Cellulomonas denverensis]NKY22620.1 ATP-binding protein [Cellulomonas denverensis]GIG24732.1 hypothetical protein Cde04nite_09760 [Cellulomonas denverensis]